LERFDLVANGFLYLIINGTFCIDKKACFLWLSYGIILIIKYRFYLCLSKKFISMKKALVFLFCLSLSFVGCYVPSATQNTTPSSGRNTPPNPAVGKCYARCKLPENKEVYQESYIAFTGDTLTEKVDYETIEVELRPKGGGTWKQKRVDKNCESPNSDDCLVWGWVEEPAQVIKMTILNDTTQSKKFRIVQVNKMKITGGGISEWRETLCPKFVTPNFVAELQEKLTAKGYDSGEKTTTLNKKLNKALVDFQKDQELPIGSFDVETLKALDIKYQY
jgi:hypothetical protein